MIRVRIETWPQGERAGMRVERELVVINDETGDEFEGNYVAAVSSDGGFKPPIPTTSLPADAHRTTRILAHDRRTGIGPLVRKAMEALLG